MDLIWQIHVELQSNSEGTSGDYLVQLLAQRKASFKIILSYLERCLVIVWFLQRWRFHSFFQCLINFFFFFSPVSIRNFPCCIFQMFSFLFFFAVRLQEFGFFSITTHWVVEVNNKSFPAGWKDTVQSLSLEFLDWPCSGMSVFPLYWGTLYWIQQSWRALTSAK